MDLNNPVLPTVISSVIISLIAFFASRASAKTAAKAAIRTAETNSETSIETERSKAETEAYSRARKLDVETIERQDKEIQELNEKLGHLNADIKMVHEENREVLAENDNLRRENIRLHKEINKVLADNDSLRRELRDFRERFTKFQRGLEVDSTQRIRERETDTNPMMDDNRLRPPFNEQEFDNG